MLVLSRKTNESIVFGNSEISIKVIEVKGNQVKIGINAPQEVAIYREELYLAIKQENMGKIASVKPDINHLPEFLKRINEKKDV